MSNPTNAQLAAKLREFGRSPHSPLDEAPYLFLAAQRLEARGEISEAMAQAGALAIMNVWRARYGFAPMAWGDPNFREDEKERALQEARAALEAALSGKEE